MTTSALIEAWEAWDETPGNVQAGDTYRQAVQAFADHHGLHALVVRSEMARLRRREPQPDRAAVLAAIAAEATS